MAMEPLHLFRKLVATSGENAFTEALAATLKTSACFRRAFLCKLGLLDDMVKLETQPAHYGEAGRPDLQLLSPQYLVLCEVKLDAWLSLKQWHRYEEILTREAGDRQKRLLAIVKDRHGVDPEILACDPEAEIWLWAEVFEMATQAVAREAQPVACFLLSELMDLLEEHRMRPFEQFPQEDFPVLYGLRGVRERMEAFFKAVIVKLGNVLPEGVHVTNERFWWDTYQDITEMYPAITFDIITPGAPWKGWVGFELCVGTEPRILLCLWDGEGKPRPSDARAQALQAHKLEWDNSEWCWYKYLESRLSAGKADYQLVNDVTQEVGAIVKILFQDF